MIGICIVFLVSDQWGEFLARKAVEQIKRHTGGPYRIYGCAPRASERHLDFLKQLNVTYVPAPDAFEGKPRSAMSEHSQLLNHLVSIALSDECDTIATFDMDSWPIVSGWDAFYSGMLSDGAPVVSMVRTEFADNFPFAAFTLFARSFWRDDQSSFASSLNGSLSRRPGETGSGILDQLAQEKRAFLRLERTNGWNPHPIMAGIYDDAFFHLGAGSRTPVFVSDEKQYGLNGSRIRRRYANDMNAASRQSIMANLQDDHDGFVRELAGGNLEKFVPIRSEASIIPNRLHHSERPMRQLWKEADSLG